jgi:hypothetical protein
MFLHLEICIRAGGLEESGRERIPFHLQAARGFPLFPSSMIRFGIGLQIADKELRGKSSIEPIADDGNSSKA